MESNNHLKKRVITYGTYDLLHHGHIRLLERAKALGDYLIVGVTADGFDLARGKINVQQSLMERIEAVRRTGLANEIIVEEYEGQKIDDIRKYNVDIFTVGSDWVGKFDYLKEYCDVIYLDRTQGISSTEIRSHNKELRIGIVGEINIVNKFLTESCFVNGIRISGILAATDKYLDGKSKYLSTTTTSFEDLCSRSDALYICSHPSLHYDHCKRALESNLHVLCESPICQTNYEFKELLRLSQEKGLVLMDGIKTAYSLAFNRLILLVKTGAIGQVLSVDATCTSLRDISSTDNCIPNYVWNTINFWGPTAMLPIFDIFGTEYQNIQLSSMSHRSDSKFDIFTKGSLVYKNGVASFKVGLGVKSEGDMIISGTKGYIYVPAPWWKTDYFEIRFENPAENKRYFYQLEGEGLRFEIRSFLQQIEGEVSAGLVSSSTSEGIITVIEQFNKEHICLS